MKSFKQIASTIRGEDVLEEGKRGLWDNIHAKRERIKNGSGERMRKPGSEGAPSNQDFKNSRTNEEVEQLDEMPGANMDTRAVHQHLKRQGWKMTRTSGGHDVFTHDEAKHHIAVPRHRQLKAPLVKGILKQAQVREEIEQLEEGRPSQRHPLEGHEYHKKTDAELVHIAKDAHAAAEAMKSHNTTAENKYRDQANDSATVRYYRQKHGMADWYKKKYGHIKEDAEQINELSDKTLTSYAQKVHDDSLKHDKDPSKRSAEKRNKSVMGFSRAINKLEARPQNEEVEQVDETWHSASGKHPMDFKSAYSRGKEWDEGSGESYSQFAQRMTKKASHPKTWHDVDSKLGKQVDQMSQAEKVKKGLAHPDTLKKKNVSEATSASVRMFNALNRAKQSREASQARGQALLNKPAQTSNTNENPNAGKFQTGPSKKPQGVTSAASPMNEQTASKLGQEREEVPFDKPYKTTKGTVTDKSGAKHTPMSRAKDLAKKAARKQAGLKEDSQIQDEVPQDKINTPAKQSLTKSAGIVKDLAKGKGKGKEGPDKFNPDPELSSEIQR